MYSTEIDNQIRIAINKYNGEYKAENCFSQLLSMGELVDRLSIVNFKLYTLKNKVMQSEDLEFRAWASVEDVKLVEERSRLKCCIDEKLIAMVRGGKFNPESKLYA